jgi:hypothetical protein
LCVFHAESVVGCRENETGKKNRKFKQIKKKLRWPEGTRAVGRWGGWRREGESGGMLEGAAAPGREAEARAAARARRGGGVPLLLMFIDIVLDDDVAHRDLDTRDSVARQRTKLLSAPPPAPPPGLRFLALGLAGSRSVQGRLAHPLTLSESIGKRGLARVPPSFKPH